MLLITSVMQQPSIQLSFFVLNPPNCILKHKFIGEVFTLNSPKKNCQVSFFMEDNDEVAWMYYLFTYFIPMLFPQEPSKIKAWPVHFEDLGEM